MLTQTFPSVKLFLFEYQNNYTCTLLLILRRKKDIITMNTNLPGIKAG